MARWYCDLQVLTVFIIYISVNKKQCFPTDLFEYTMLLYASRLVHIR